MVVVLCDADIVMVLCDADVVVVPCDADNYGRSTV